ncbi:hypothetical protein H0H92_001696, partial [Tricholoma furcatifolium]
MDGAPSCPVYRLSKNLSSHTPRSRHRPPSAPGPDKLVESSEDSAGSYPHTLALGWADTAHPAV